MKKIVTILLAVSFASGLCGCFPVRNLIPEAATEYASEAITETEAETTPSDETTADITDFDTQVIGNDEVGYMQAPADFVPFVDVVENTDYQYSDAEGSTIFTMNVITEDITVEDAQQSIAYMLESDGGENIKGASVTVNGYDAKQVYCYFSDVDKFLVVHLIPYEGKIYYLSAEFTAENSDMFDYVQTWQPFAIE